MNRIGTKFTSLPENALLLTVDHHFSRTPDGKVWVKGIHDARFWEKYLSVFGKIYAIVRMKDADYCDVQGWILSSYPGVEFVSITFFRGIGAFVARYFKIRAEIKRAVQIPQTSCAICRVPSNIGFLAVNALKKAGKPYALEVTTDLSESFFYTHGPIKAIAYKVWSHILKRACLQAKGVSYVTEKAIQAHFPPGKNAFTTHYSSIDLPEEYFYLRDGYGAQKKTCILVHVSTLESNGKGHSVFLETLRRLKEKGHAVEGVVVGGGTYKAYYEAEAQEKKLDGVVRFIGHIGEKEALREILIRSDLLLFPSETEGLPRCVLEAMACSMPCVASNVGGIPELLETNCLAQPKDVDRFCAIVENLLRDEAAYRHQSERNYNKALEFCTEALKERRDAFYKRLLEISEQAV